MSNRLNQEREKLLQPKRIEGVAKKLKQLGFEVQHDNTAVRFQYKGHTITLYPYSGWFTGKGVIDGRGFDKLLKQITP